MIEFSNFEDSYIVRNELGIRLGSILKNCLGKYQFYQAGMNTYSEEEDNQIADKLQELNQEER